MTTTTPLLTPSRESTYDQIPYESMPFAQTHPDRLATIGALFGMNPPAPSKARVLELGCAAGGNLLPLGAMYPNVQCVGVDLSSVQIKAGQIVVDALGLDNVDLRHASITDIDESYGKFDYILCHGVFSWIPREVQDHVLHVCRHNLADNGIAYISYNTYPGWHMRGMIRDMMQYHVSQFADPETKIKQARAVHKFLSDNVPENRNKAYAELLKTELAMLEKQADYYLFHEHLEEHNAPVYFHEFADRAGAAGLQYLGEAVFATMLASDFPEEVGRTLKQVAPSIVRMEQFMDFLRNRMFRQTLLVKSDVVLNRELGPDSLKNLYISSALKPHEDNKPEELTTAEKQQFKSPTGHTLTTGSPAAKVAVQALSETWPDSIAFDELVTATIDRLPADSAALDGGRDAVARQLGSELLRCFSHGLIECHVTPNEYTVKVAERPKTSPLIRWQAENHRPITNLRHETVAVDQFGRHLLTRLDGSQTAADLSTWMSEEAARGKLSVKINELQVSDPVQLQKHLTRVVAQMLPRLAQAALLVR